MVANMATIDPIPSRHQAAADLDAVAKAQRAVRDRPWPMWLYPVNVLLLGAIALLGSTSFVALVVLGLLVGVVNYGAGYLMGTPFAVPTSRGFLAATTAAMLFLVAAMIAGFAGLSWLVVLCAAATAISYAVGSILHYRSTRR